MAFNYSTNYDPDEVLLRLQKKQAIPKVSKRNQNSLYNAMKVSKSMSSGESLWIHNRDDLLALAKDAEDGWFNGVLEDTLRRLSSKITLVGIYASVSIPYCPSHTPATCSALLLRKFALNLGRSACCDQYEL